MEDTYVTLTEVNIPFAETKQNELGPVHYFAVYDGHDGAEAAQYLERNLHKRLFANDFFLAGKFQQAFYDTFAEVDKEITAGMGGSTAACMLMTNRTVTVANLGDSEIVLAYEGTGIHSGTHHVVLTTDVGPDDFGEERRVYAGGGFVVGHRVNGEVAVSRAFGDVHYKRPHYKADLISAVPKVDQMELHTKDMFILISCDGLYENGVFTHATATQFVVDYKSIKDDPKWIAEQLAAEAIKKGSCDNVTILLLFLKWD